MKRKTLRASAALGLALLLTAQLVTGALTAILPTAILPVAASEDATLAVPDAAEVHKTDPQPRENIILNAYLIPMYDEDMRRQQLQYCADANIDVLSHVYPDPVWVAEDHTAEWYKQAMREAAEYGLTLQTRELRLQQCLSKTDEEIIALANEYKDIPGFGGFYIVDEPANPSIYAHTENLLRRVCPDTLVNVNFLPRGAYGENYLRQLTDYGSLLDYNGTLSLDAYCFPPDGGVNEAALFSNYADLHRAGLMTGNDTAVYVQAVGSPNQYGYRRPSPADLRYNMMAALAYGIKEIKFFTWGTPVLSDGNYTEAIIDRDGVPTDLYDDVCAINAYVHAIGQYIAACDATAIYHSKQHSSFYQAVPADLFIQPVGDCEIIVSLMEERGGSEEYVMLVNKDITAAQTFTCAVDGVTALEIVDAEGNLVPLALSNGQFTLTLEAGDSAVIKLPAGDFIKSAEKKTDLAQSATVSATASTSEANMYIYNTYDGLKNGGGVCLKSPDGAPQSLTFDLHEVTTINRVDVSPARLREACGISYPSELTIAVSTDGKQWQAVAATKAGDISQPITTVPTFRFADTDARYVRVTVSGYASALTAYELGDISIYHDDGSIPAGEATLYEAPVYDANTNLALNKPIAGYSSTCDVTAWNCHNTYINDGNNATAWSSALFMHDTPDGEEWIIIDLAAVYDINKVVLNPRGDASTAINAFPNDYQIDVSIDGTNYTTVFSDTNANTPVSGEMRTLTFETVKARFVRLLTTKMTLNTGNAGYGIEIEEMEIYGPGTVESTPVAKNVALGAPVIDYSSSIEEPSWNCHSSYLTDGTDKGWASGFNRNATPDAEEWITVDLAMVYKINKIVLTPQGLWNGTNGLPEDYRIEVSTDNVTYQTVAEVTGDLGQQDCSNRVLTFETVEARYVRFRATKLTISSSAGMGYCVELDEMEVYEAPATDAPTEFNLSLGKPVVGYSSTVDVPEWGCHHTYLTDGTDNGWASGFNRHDTPDGEEWITVDLKDTYIINKVLLDPQGVMNGTNVFPVDYCIEVSDDNSRFTEVAKVTGDIGQQDDGIRIVTFEAVNARYVRFRATKLSISSGVGVGFCVELDEMSVFGPSDIPVEPDETEPPEGGTDEPVNANVALNKPITGYSSTTDQPVWNCHHTYINDGNRLTAWATELWRNDTADAEEWIVIDLLSTLNINKVVLATSPIAANGSNTFPNDYTIEVSTDGVNFTAVVTRIDDNTPTSSEDRVLTFETVEARYVRFAASELTLFTGAGGGGYGAEIRELEVYEAQAEPETDAPETDAPETDAPETDAPETDAPETDAPETDAPETDAPETDAPETDAPETDAPETDAPETNAPETDAPETNAPETDAPETDAPETDAPETRPDTGNGDIFDDDEEEYGCSIAIGGVSIVTLLLMLSAAYVSRRRE